MTPRSRKTKQAPRYATTKKKTSTILSDKGTLTASRLVPGTHKRHSRRKIHDGKLHATGRPQRIYVVETNRHPNARKLCSHDFSHALIPVLINTTECPNGQQVRRKNNTSYSYIVPLLTPIRSCASCLQTVSAHRLLTPRSLSRSAEDVSNGIRLDAVVLIAPEARLLHVDTVHSRDMSG